ncbi:hypothetical protein J6590_021564 [Homalodisca vitripennis]|nr:hypothetical protein J6590_021564 [Homalodisca vitripennis]
MCEGPTCVTSVAWVLPEENCGTWKRTNRRLTAKPAIFAASSYGYPSHFSTLLRPTRGPRLSNFRKTKDNVEVYSTSTVVGPRRLREQLAPPAEFPSLYWIRSTRHDRSKQYT